MLTGAVRMANLVHGRGLHEIMCLATLSQHYIARKQTLHISLAKHLVQRPKGVVQAR
jgi:hypothetical protein